MAKRIVSEYHTFNPATKTITIPNRIIPRKNLLLVTNATTNTVLYNFSDPDLTITGYTCPFSSTGTQFVLNYDTSAMGTSDAIMVLEDIPEDRMTVSEVMQDPTNKIRVAAPESLIDTDFEYGLQPIKWESIAMVQNIPAFYYRGGGNSLNVAPGGVVGGNQAPRSTMTVTCSSPHGLTTSDVVNVSYTSNIDAEGSFVVLTVPSTTTFTYTAKGQINGNVANSATTIQGGANYDVNGAPSRIINGLITSDNAAASPGSIVTVNTVNKHGLLPGSPLFINSATTVTINGAYNVLDVPTPTSFRYQTVGTQTGTVSPTSGQVIIFPRPEANFVHRASDGGVMINTNNVQEGVAAIRQTRRYFRYQSGKGLQMSTGTKMTPSYDINNIVASGTSVTVTVQQNPSFYSGVTVVMEGIETNAGAINPYNGSFTVAAVSSAARTFTYFTTTSSTDTTPMGSGMQATIRNWRGANNRVGIFDSQNGFYFEYDGQNLFAVRRRSIREMAGTITATSGSTNIVGVGTKFHKQLTVGDLVVIRGQSYQVVQIDSATSLDISPAYRAATVSGVRMNLTENIRTPQSEWNLDRCDGTGPSGYNLDISKMQMCYIDYTWYGAGFCRFGFRMTDGNVVYCHKVANNNVNNQSYMRSGNLPARYEVTNIGPYSRLLSGSTSSFGVSFASGDTTMVVKDAQYWNTSGAIMVQQGTNVEVMTYSTKSYNPTLNAWNLGGIDRRQFGANTSNLTFIPSEFEGGTLNTSSQCSVTYITCDCAPMIMHWGTSVIMDGGFTEDRNIRFAYTKPSAITVNANTSIAILSLRLAPSVDNSIAAAFGNREIINRMQLQTRNMGLVCNTSVQVLGILNPAGFGGTNAPVIPGAWSITSVVTAIGSGSLAQIIDHTGNTVTVTGGEQIFGFITGSGGDTYDISQVRDLGHSIIGGDGSTRTPGYPNGPDILTIVIRNTNAGPAVLSNMRLTWVEAQA
jgi:hypothetical protein